MTMCIAAMPRSLALLAGSLSIFIGVMPAAAQVGEQPSRTVTSDTARVGEEPGPSEFRPDQPVRFILEPILATAPRERAVAPPVATIMVDPDRVRQTQNQNPYDLVRRVTGIEVHDQGQGPGFASNVVLRGFTSDHSSDVLLVVDGVPVNLPVHGHVEGYADWSTLFPGAVSSLRVIHGPASPLHGDFSIAGAVEVFTRLDADGIEGNADVNAFGDLAGWLTAGRRGPAGGGLVGLDLRRREGWRENSGQQIGNALARGWRQLGDGRLEGGLALHAADWGSPGFISLADFEEGRLSHAADRTDGGEQARLAAHGRYAAPVGEVRYLQWMVWGIASTWDLYLNTPGHEDAFGNLYQSGETDRRWGAGTEVEVSWVPSFGEFTVGTSVRQDRSRYDRDRTLRRRVVEREIALDAGHRAAGVYARWRHTFGNRFGVDLGGRLDHLRWGSYNRLGLDPSFSSGSAELARDQASSGWIPPASFHVIGDQGPPGEWVNGRTTVLSPKVGARFAVADRWTATVSSSRGFRSAVGVLGDPERPPVLAWAQEVGLGYERTDLDVHLALFRMDVSNERIQDPITLNISSAGSSVRQGVEGSVTYELHGGILLSGRGTYTDARLSGRYADAHHDHGTSGPGGNDTDAEDLPDGQRVPGIARYLGRLSATVPVREVAEVRTEWRVTGPYIPIGEADVRTTPFSVLDLGVSFPVRERILLDLEVRNVFDRAYSETRSSGFVNPGMPRSVGLAFRYLGRAQ